MASGSQRRLTTLHDRAALRVHPDGTKVTTRESRYTTRDLRGNRIAANAGGAGNVKKRKWAARSDEGSEPLEEFDIESDSDEYQPSENQPSSTDSCAGEAKEDSEGDGRKRKRQRKDPRVMKRAQFYQNFEFIVGGKNTVGSVATSSDPLLPSSDLLKCIHRFAAGYYSDRGQLIDATRIARQRKVAKGNGETGSRSTSRSTADSTPGDESDHSGSEAAPTSSTTPQTQKKKGRQGADLVKDMYKMFDGSALVALGFFVHEHIERLVRRDRDFERDPEQESEQEGGEGDEEDN